MGKMHFTNAKPLFDDFVTTGQTLVSIQNLLVLLGKNCVIFVRINNKL